jgi:hypothetical protein
MRVHAAARRTSRLPRVILPVAMACPGLLLVLRGVWAAPIALPRTIAYGETVADVISRITTASLEHELAGLTGERAATVAGITYTIATRYSSQTHAISMATRDAYEQFAALGMDVAFHDCVWSGNHWRNVVAVKPGLVDANEVYLVTAYAVCPIHHATTVTGVVVTTGTTTLLDFALLPWPGRQYPPWTANGY